MEAYTCGRLFGNDERLVARLEVSASTARLQRGSSSIVPYGNVHMPSVCRATWTKMELQQSFDTELFIDEVEKRRAIWDFESEDYKNRVLKRSAWVELVDLFFEKDATVEQKKIYGKWFLVNPGEVDIMYWFGVSFHSYIVKYKSFDDYYNDYSYIG